MPVNLMIHEVADAYESTDESDGYHQSVISPERCTSGCENRVQDHCYDKTYSASMACKTSFPCVEDFNGMLGIIVPGIEKYMPETCADDSGHYAVNQQRADPFFRCSFMAEHPGYDVVAKDESDYKHYAVPPHGEWTEVEEHGVNVPGDKVEH